MRCVYCDVIRKCTPNSPVQAKIWHENLRFRCDITETPNRPSLSICGQFTLRYTRVNAVSANQRRAKEGEIPDHLIKVHIIEHNLYIICGWNSVFPRQSSRGISLSGVQLSGFIHLYHVKTGHHFLRYCTSYSSVFWLKIKKNKITW